MDDEKLERILWDVIHAKEEPDAESFDFNIQPVLEKTDLSEQFIRTFGAG